jgi:hypothetical protein
VSAPPKTVLTASAEEEAAIRAVVRSAAGHPNLAGPEHVDGLLKLVLDPQVSDPIYDLPRPFTRESVAAWVAESETLRQEGRCILAVSLDEAGEVASYSRYTVWPERSSAEIAGARRADLQKAIDGAGFRRMGEVESTRPDGTVRRSLYWELTRDEWRLRHRL